ncbi:transposable element tc3 transposase [Trichonephila clavipes]|nr:transposable element tc3 transposase [Trichonephila clavipes]
MREANRNHTRFQVKEGDVDFPETYRTGEIVLSKRRLGNLQQVVDAVAKKVEEDRSQIIGKTSIRPIAAFVDQPHFTVHKILRKVLRYYPCKLLLVKQLVADDLDNRQSFVLWFLARVELQNECPWNILWFDEAHFHPEDANGGPAYIIRYVKQVLRRRFGDDRIISRHFLTVWRHKSPDLNPCNFRLKGYLTAMTYRDPITSLFDLKENIERYARNFPVHATFNSRTCEFTFSDGSRQWWTAYRTCFANFC